MIAWIETHCVFTQGEWIGQPFKLLPWQKILILELFEVYPSGLRRFRWALWGVPKKQGKTELAAALALYMLIGDGEPSPLVVCAAASDEQADLVFGAAKTMCELSPTLSQICETWEREITVPSIPGARLKRVAATAGTNDGQNIHAVICDELHEWRGEKGRKVWTVLTNGTGARRQPLVLQITTAGYDRDTICFEQYEKGCAVQDGTVDDKRYHFYWKAAPADADYRDPEVWRAANPSFGITVHEEFYADQLNNKPENEFRRYFLNQWTTQKVAWLPDGGRDWDLCEVPGVEIPNAAPVYAAVDAAYKYDSTAIVLAHFAGENKIIVEAHIFDPPPGDSEDAILDMSIVEGKLRQLREQYRIRALAYDPAYFGRSAQMLADEGMLLTKFPQTPGRMIKASANIYEAICSHRIQHPGDDKFTAHVKAGASKPMPSGWRLVKSDTGEKVDALLALAMAVDTGLSIEQHSVYESKELLVIG